MSEHIFSEEEEALRQQLLKLFDQLRKDTAQFWQVEYPAKSSAERIRYWLVSTHTGMRSQGEATVDSYSEFSPQWYSFARSMEPDFDALFVEAMKGLEGPFDWAEYLRRIAG
jgi:hypothetical protein